MRRTPVTSASIVSVGYDDDSSTLEVEFVGGRVYRYFAVPRAVYRSLLEAASVGATFNVVVRTRYPSAPVS